MPVLITGVENALAVNWEGHENFFHEAVPLEEFTDSVPQPLLQPLPTCEERQKKHDENPFEQVPLPGQNCREQELIPP